MRRLFQAAPSEAAPTLAERLRLVRGRQSQAAFAAALGIHKNSIGSYERGDTKPDSEFLARACALCDVNPDWLLLGRGPYRREEESAGTPGAADGPDAGHRDHASVPVVGLANCGIEGWYNANPLALSVSTPRHYTRQGEMLAVIAIGTSMIPDGIREGYVVLCDAGRKPDRNDAVFVEKSNGSSSIKRYMGHDERWIHLQGWLKPDEHGGQGPYSEKLALDSIQRMATVVFVQRKA